MPQSPLHRLHRLDPLREFIRVLLRDLAHVAAGSPPVLPQAHQIRDLDNLIDHVIIINDGKVLINEPLDEVSKQLSFKTLSDIPDYMSVYYSEESFRGTSVVVRNQLGERTKVNLEHLFNAVTGNPETIELFTNTYAS